MKTNDKIKIYFIEYSDCIKFYGLNNNRIVLYKNDFTFKQLQNLINTKKFNFINLLKK